MTSSRGWTPEDERPLPELPFFQKILEDLWEGYFTLIVWTLVLWLLSIPLWLSGTWGWIVAAFTLAPGWTGLMVACGHAARGGFARIGDAARGTFRLYWRSVALTLPLMILIALFVFTAQVIVAFPERREMVLAWAMQGGLCLMLAVLHIYLLPILALYETPLKRTAQLAVVLVARSVWRTLALLGLAMVLLTLTRLHPLVWLIVPGVWIVVVMNAVWRMTKLDRRPTTGSEPDGRAKEPR